MTTSSKSPLRAVVFDLDGTLIDSMPFVLRAFAHALAPYRPELSEADIFDRLGGPPERTLLDLIGHAAGTEEALRRLESFGFSNGHLAQPFSGMREMLTALRAGGLKLAVWTGRDRATTAQILRAHDLESFFHVVVCGDDLPTHKPHPAGLMDIIDRLAVEPEAVLFAGDADADVLGGHGAGIRTILIRHGRTPDELVIAKAWRVVDTPAQAYAVVQAG